MTEEYLDPHRVLDNLFRGILTAEGVAMRDLARGHVIDVRDLPAMGGMNILILKAMDDFMVNPESRLVMTCARRAAIPYSEARARWHDPYDLAREVAWDAHLAEIELRRCPQCGTDPHDYQDPDTKRLLKEPRVGIQLHDCHMCAQLAQHGATIDAKDKERGVGLRVIPRGPGEPFVQMGDPGG